MTELKFIRHKASGEITRSIEQPLIFGQQHAHLKKDGGIRAAYEYLTQEEIDVIILPEEKEHKIKQVKKLRDKNLLQPTPQTVGSYTGTGVENKTLNVSMSDYAMLSSIVNTMSEGSKRGWTDSNKDRLHLTLDDFKSLLGHLTNRDDKEYEQYELKKLVINSLETPEEVRNFDINEVMI
jgi:hypothetical protein